MQRLRRALERLANRLSQSDAAQLSGFLSHHIALGRGRPGASRTSTDAESARLQIIADQMPYLTAEQQAHVAAVIAALANGTPDRAVELKRAVRAFVVSTLDSESLAYLAKACVDGVTKQLAGEQV